MRPIDADAFLSQYTGDILTAQIDYAQGMRDILDDIRNAPTIELERKKARWIDAREHCGEFLCSNCHETNINNSYKYCPHCGAEMIEDFECQLTSDVVPTCTKKEEHEIGYRECSDALLKMWMDKVLTDNQYYNIIKKLFLYWACRKQEEGK